MSAEGVTNMTSLTLSQDLVVQGSETITGSVTFAGDVNLGDAAGDTTTVTGKETIVSTNASALAVGRQGATSPALKVDASAASSATGVAITAAASGSGSTIAAIGGTNETLTVSGKGTGAVALGQATSTDVRLIADQPIADSSGNELIKFTKAASAVNEITIANAATNGAPSITATGGDASVPLVLAPKGQSPIVLNSFVVGYQGNISTKTTSSTLTAGDVFSGIITVNQGASGASAQQLPTAADMDASSSLLSTNSMVIFSMINTSTVDAEDASITTNTGWTLVGSMDVPAYSAAGSLNSSGRFLARKTGTAAWTLYRIS